MTLRSQSKSNASIMSNKNDANNYFNCITVGVDEAARMVSLSRRYLYNQMQLGRLPSVKAGRRRMIAVDDLYAWAHSLKDKQTWGSESATQSTESEK